MKIKTARGYERRIFAKEDVCEVLDICKNKPLAIDYTISGDVVVLMPQGTDMDELHRQVTKLNAKIIDHITARKVYDSI